MYEELMIKAENCKLNALRAESDWARFFWASVSEKLESEARELPIARCR